MNYGKVVPAGLLIFIAIFLVYFLFFGLPAIDNQRVASPADIRDAIETCPGVSERLRFVAGPISIGELNTLLGHCQEQAALEAQKRGGGANAPK